MLFPILSPSGNKKNLFKNKLIFQLRVVLNHAELLGNCSMCYTHIFLHYFCVIVVMKWHRHSKKLWCTISWVLKLISVLSCDAESLSMVTYCADFVFPCKSDLLNKHINRQSMIVDKNTVSSRVYITIAFWILIPVLYCIVSFAEIYSYCVHNKFKFNILKIFDFTSQAHVRGEWK